MRLVQHIGIVLFCLCILSLGTGFAEIIINPEYLTGDEITISGNTNYNTDNSVLIEVWPSSFGPKGKYEPSMRGGGSQVVRVMGGNNSENTWKSSFNSSEWLPDSYMARAEVIGKDYAETTTFTLTDKIQVEPVQSKNESILRNITEKAITNEMNVTLTQTPEIEQMNKTIPIGPIPTQKSPVGLSTVGLSLLICLAGIFIARVR
jgi:hypothetical protein